MNYRRSALAAAILSFAQLCTTSALTAAETAAARLDALANYIDLNVPHGTEAHPLAVLIPGCLG